MNIKEANRFKQSCFEEDRKKEGLKAVRIYLSIEDIEQAKQLFISPNDTRKNVQRDAVTRAFDAGLEKQKNLFGTNTVLMETQQENQHLKRQYQDFEMGTRARIEELELELRCELSNLKNARAQNDELRKQLSNQSKPRSCAATTKAGKQCKHVGSHPVKDEFYCELHYNMYYGERGTRV